MLSGFEAVIFHAKDLILPRHSSHGVQYTPLQAESVNVRIVK